MDETVATVIGKLDKIDQKILKMLKDKPCSVSYLSSKLNVSKSTVSRRLKKLSKYGYVESDGAPKGSIKFFRLTDLGRTVAGVPPRSLAGMVWVHNFRVSFDVVGLDVSRLSFGRRSGLRNVDQVVWRDGGYVFYLNGDRSVTVVFPGFEVRRSHYVEDFIRWYTFHLVHSVLLLRNKYGVTVDIKSARVSRQEISDALFSPYSRVVEKEKTFRFNKPATSWFAPVMQNSFAKIDLTPYLCRETNDNDYEELLILEPIFALHTVKTLKDLDEKLTPAINELTKQIRLHLRVLESMDLTLKEIRRSFRERRPGLLDRILSWFRRIRDGKKKD